MTQKTRTATIADAETAGDEDAAPPLQVPARKTPPAPDRATDPVSAPAPTPAPSKLDTLVALLTRPGGASLAEMQAASGWQAHSVRGALAGALRKRGHATSSERHDGVRRYRIGQTGAGA